MSTSIVVGVAFAVAAFWAVGAYNRLMRLRARCTEAFVVLSGHLLDYSRIAKDHLLFLATPELQGEFDDVEDIPSLLCELQDGLQTIELAMHNPKGMWWNDDRFQAIGIAGNTLASTWGRLRSMSSDAAGGLAIPEALVREWDANSMGLKISMDRFNGCAAEYNEALAQIPAVLIGKFFQLRPFTLFSIFNEA
ncbi:MAG: hypothetical protein CFE44_20365 [Burkholderiales bacterium PBB4]|nr:MAG: hypothetical protein CFE44_20365 [Burkholderiales bacterium PBB4]